MNKLTESLNKFYTSNKSIIASMIVYGALLLVKKQFGIKIPGLNFIEREPEPEKRTADNCYTRMYNPTNSVEESLMSIWKAAITSSSSFTKESCSRQVVELITGLDQVSDATVSYAIKVLGKIAESTSSSYTKESITNDIIKINRKAKIVYTEEA